MKKITKYKFLLKPIFFIFNLLFATWLVFKIEEITPSDFGRYKTLFEDPPRLSPDNNHHKQYLKKLCHDYKSGKLDSLELELKLDGFLTDPKDVITK